jgi:hypothetical protein
VIIVGTHAAERLSAVLSKALPVASPLVDHYRDMAVWDQAIIECLATFAELRQPLPSDVRERVNEFLDDPGVSSKVRRHAGHYLAEIPTWSH